MLILKARDYWVLKHLIDRGLMTFESTVSWAFRQYTDDGIDPTIEKIGLAIDLDELFSIINDQLHIKEHEYAISAEFLLGEARASFVDSELNELHRQPIYNLAYENGQEINVPKNERDLILSVTNYWGDYDSWEPKNANWQEMDKNREKNWSELLEICRKYEQAYRDAIQVFNA